MASFAPPRARISNQCPNKTNVVSTAAASKNTSPPPVSVTYRLYSHPAPIAIATSTIMSSVRFRRARKAPSKKIQPA